MLIKRPGDVKSSEITDRDLYLNRRQFIRRAAAAALAAGMPGWNGVRAAAPEKIRLPAIRKSAYSTNEPLNSLKDITTYNNFYEFGTEKDDPARYAGRLKVRPWTVRVDGEVKRPRTFDVDELIRLAPLEERIYRLRCVEAWSMVIPWAGYPIAELIKRVGPTGNAKYVEFKTLHDPEQMPGQRATFFGSLDWP